MTICPANILLDCHNIMYPVSNNTENSLLVFELNLPVTDVSIHADVLIFVPKSTMLQFFFPDGGGGGGERGAIGHPFDSIGSQFTTNNQ